MISSKLINEKCSLAKLENLLKKTKDPHSGISLAEEISGCIKNLQIDVKGECPDPVREAGEGTKGELWIRNRLAWLRTIPLEKDVSFVITHIEAPVYYKEKKGRNSADLLGIWHDSRSTKLGIVELKSGRKGDNILYAIVEGLRNACLHRQGLERLRRGWLSLKKSSTKTINLRKAWGNGTPFPSRLKNTQLIIIGDWNWIREQECMRQAAKKAINDIKRKFRIETSIYSLNKQARYNSKPYRFFPLVRWL